MLFGSVTCQANCLFGALALRDVGIAQQEAAVRYCVPPHLDDPAIGTCALNAQLLPGVFVSPDKLGF